MQCEIEEGDKMDDDLFKVEGLDEIEDLDVIKSEIDEEEVSDKEDETMAEEVKQVDNLTGKGRLLTIAVTEELKADVQNFVKRFPYLESESMEYKVNQMLMSDPTMMKKYLGVDEMSAEPEPAEGAKPVEEEGKGDKMSEVRYTREQLRKDYGIIISEDKDSASRDELLEMIDNNMLLVDSSKFRFIDGAFRAKYEARVAEALDGKDPDKVKEFLEKNKEISYRKDRIVSLFEDFEKGKDTPPIEPPAGDDPPKDVPPRDDPPKDEPEVIEMEQAEGEYPGVYYARVMAMLKGVDFEALLADTGEYTPEEGETLKKVTIVKNPDKKNTHVHCSDVNCAVGVFVAMLQDIKEKGEENRRESAGRPRRRPEQRAEIYEVRNRRL